MNKSKKRFPKRAIIGVIALVSVTLGLYLLSNNYLTSYEYAENVETVDWLPDTATNISYFKSYLFTAYEFDISEEEFLKLAEKKGWKVKKINQTKRVLRYTYGVNQKNNTSKKTNTEAIIDSGYYYNKRFSNGGGITVVYDNEKQTAYFQSDPR
jgi:hypothetical protein